MYKGPGDSFSMKIFVSKQRRGARISPVSQFRSHEITSNRNVSRWRPLINWRIQLIAIRWPTLQDVRISFYEGTPVFSNPTPAWNYNKDTKQQRSLNLWRYFVSTVPQNLSTPDLNIRVFRTWQKHILKAMVCHFFHS